MTKEQFKNKVNVIGGTFDFTTDKYEGLIGVSNREYIIWVDDLGYGTRQVDEDSDGEPRNQGEYKNVDELLSTFMVDGELFAESVLPAIEQLHTIYYG